MKLTEEKRTWILSKVKDQRSDANKHYESEIEPKVIERYDIYLSKPEFYEKMFERLSEVSSLTSSEVADTIEWTLPALMKLFFGSEDVITVQGEQEEDDQNASIVQELINFQLQRKNKGFLVFMNWFKDALITNLGIVKCSWIRETKKKTYAQQMTFEELAVIQQNENIEVLEAKEISPGLFNIKWQEEKVVKNQPVIENVLASEFRFSPSARDLDSADFVAHRKVVTIDYLRRKAKAGEYEDVKDIEQLGEPTYTQLDEKQSNYAVDKKNDGDIPNRKVELYECYIKMDINDDGLLEDVIVTISGDVILKIQENTSGRHPFFVLSPIIDPHKIWGDRGFADIIAQLQHLKTAMLRLLVYSMTLSNNPQAAIDSTRFEDIDDVTEGRQYWRVNGDPRSAVFPIPTNPIHPLTMPFLEYLDQQGEKKSGVSRYSQGLSPDALNKTATGISIITQASNQRLELIARIFNETGIVALFRYMVELNQKYIDQATVIRLTNQRLIVNPADLAGEFDLVVNAGTGGSKEGSLSQLQLLLGLYPQLLQLQIANPMNIYNCVKKLIEEMGYKNVDDFITPPMQSQQPMMGGVPIGQQQGENPQVGATGLPGGGGGISPEMLAGLVQQLQRQHGQTA